MLSGKQIGQIREELDNCKKPLFFFHDDADGLCSFLLLYKYIREGKGVIVKSIPHLDEKFIRMATEYGPDKIFILDIAMVKQEFIDNVKAPVIWIDHHEPLKRDNVKYFNPRLAKKDDNIPATCICYQVTKKDLWIAMCGCIGDWFIPDFFEEFKKKYPDLIGETAKNPGDILFTTKLGKLIKIISSVLKGNTDDVMKCIKILTRIDGPYEILDKKTARGRYIYKRFKSIDSDYERLLEEALQSKTEDKLFIYSYNKSKMSFTGNLANELMYHMPNKTIVIAREKDDEMRMSLRSNKKLPPIIKKALEGLEGYGGGHEYACGANVKTKDFKKFLDRIKEQI